MIVIGVPVDKNFTIDVRTAAYCSAEASRQGVQWGYVASRDAGVGRSTFVHNALKNPNVTHLYFMDYDVVPPNGTLRRLVEYDVPIVAGIYPMQTDELVWSFKCGSSWFPKHRALLADGLLEVDCVGGSTLLVKREVFEKLKAPCFKIEYKEVTDEGRCYDEGEDEYFSRLVKEAGYKIMVDPTIQCKHYNYREL
jgi:hypothetical protein